MTPSAQDPRAVSGEWIWATPLTPPLPGSIHIRKYFIPAASGEAHIRHGWVGQAAGWYMIAVCLAMAVLGPALCIPVYLRNNPPFTLVSNGMSVLMVCFLVGGIIGMRVGIANVTDRTVIERSSGWISREWLFGTAWTVRRSGIVAIQCLHGGWVMHKHDQYEHYQLNLVMADGIRLHVCSVEREEWVRELAGQLSDFLRVPLSDQIDETRTPKPTMWQ